MFSTDPVGSTSEKPEARLTVKGTILDLVLKDCCNYCWQILGNFFRECRLNLQKQIIALGYTEF